jgi:hypothetical protein
MIPVLLDRRRRPHDNPDHASYRPAVAPTPARPQREGRARPTTVSSRKATAPEGRSSLRPFASYPTDDEVNR